ncbi:MAG TPA: DUF3311 domain-containing protein [Candidatus Baltobacteraceae bacterium]
MRPSAKAARIALAVVPAIMLTLAVPFANRVEPRIAGVPFLLAWITFWVAITPLFLFTIYRLEGRR